MKSLILLTILFSTQAFASIEKLNQILKTVEAKGKFVGLSVLVVTSDKTFKSHYGYQDLENKTAPNNQTMYEIGSISKVFTRLLLTTQNTISLNDSIDKFLPEGIRAPRPNGEDVTIENLITHSGIKFGVPCTIRANDPNKLLCFGFHRDEHLTNPYRGVTRDNLFKFINEYSFTVEEFPEYFPAPGVFNSYSNSGYALLGELLGLTHGTSFEKLLFKNVLAPLRMYSTKALMPCQRNNSCKNLAKVYRNIDNSWKKTTIWHMPGMNAAGGLKSSIDDMEKFLRASMLVDASRLQRNMFSMQQPLKVAQKKLNSNLCKNGDRPDVNLCNYYKNYYLGWEGFRPQSPIFYHAGRTGASEAMIAFTKDKSVGVVVLSNSRNPKLKNDRHIPNDIAVCALQLLTTNVAKTDFCKKLLD